MLIPEADGFEETWREKVREKRYHLFGWVAMTDFWIFSMKSSSHFDTPAIKSAMNFTYFNWTNGMCVKNHFRTGSIHNNEHRCCIVNDTN